MNARIPGIGVKTPCPFVQAATRGGLGVLRIQRQQDEVVRSMLRDLLDRVLCERVPVTHCDHHARVQVASQFGFERLSLPPGVLEDRAPAADFRVMMRDVLRACGGDQPREGLPRDACKRKIDDVGIREQVVQKWTNVIQRIRPTELKEHHPKFHNL
jgi:hypothetical protein